MLSIQPGSKWVWGTINKFIVLFSKLILSNDYLYDFGMSPLIFGVSEFSILYHLFY